MAEKRGKDEGRPQRLKAIAESIAEKCDRVHNFHKDESLEYAYSRDTFRRVANQFEGLSDSPRLAHTEDSLLQ